MHACFSAADIFLPRTGTDMERWSMVACDQYTSQVHYWQNADQFVGSLPSTLRMILPEVYLGQPDEAARITAIHNTMDCYLAKEVLTCAVTDGFVLTERKTASGTRLGLVGKIDLEAYNYTPDSASPIRATEQTVAERIPPRVRIREGAKLELPHIMVLADDSDMTLVEPVFANRSGLPVLYDTALFGNGGHIRGYAVTGNAATVLEERIANAQAGSNGFFLAMGDGNHSLAVAKTCWEKLKAALSPEQRAIHPARYALAELVNLHSPALLFRPIHRILTGVSAQELHSAFMQWLKLRDMRLEKGDDIVLFDRVDRLNYTIIGAGNCLPITLVQSFLDTYLSANPACSIDYIHGEQALTELVESTGRCGILLPSIPKASLFPGIRAGGVLPRKTFSLGEACEKRYYMECRKIL